MLRQRVRSASRYAPDVLHCCEVLVDCNANPAGTKGGTCVFFAKIRRLNVLLPSSDRAESAFPGSFAKSATQCPMILHRRRRVFHARSWRRGAKLTAQSWSCTVDFAGSTSLHSQVPASTAPQEGTRRSWSGNTVRQRTVSAMFGSVRGACLIWMPLRFGASLAGGVRASNA